MTQSLGRLEVESKKLDYLVQCEGTGTHGSKE